jgi:hypothetical protein
LNNYRRHIENTINNKGSNWTSRQAYQALDILSASAKEAGAGITFLDNINARLFDEVLHLEKEGLTAHIAIVLNLQASKKIWASSPEINN